MADLERFEFTVPGYTPDTMPLNRLLEYLNNLSIVLGEASELHLVGIETSSTRPVLMMRHDVATRARARASEARQGRASNRRRDAFEAIRKLVSEDGGEAATLTAPEGKILEFPRLDLGLDQVVHSVRQATSLEGELIRVGGLRENAQLLMQEFSGKVVAGCTAPRAVARALAAFLYKPISVSGTGNWHRTVEGKWEVTNLHVQSFYPLDEDEPEDVIAKLRAANVTWPDDANEQLSAMRQVAA